MSIIGQLTMNVVGNTAPLEKSMARASTIVGKFQAATNQSAAAMTAMSTASSSGAASAAASMAMFAGKVVGVYSAYQVLRGVVNTAKMGVVMAADAERASIAFEVMLKSAGGAKTMLKDLQLYADKTPFEMPELRTAAKTLVGFGVAGNDVMPMLKQLGQLSSGLDVPINELAQLMGRVRVNAHLTSREVHEFTNRGVPLIHALADVMGVADSEVMKLVEDGKIGFPQVQQAIAGMTGAGGQFAGMTERLSESMSGLWSTFEDNTTQIVKKLAEATIKVLGLKEALKAAADASMSVNQALSGGAAPAPVRTLADFGDQQGSYRDAHTRQRVDEEQRRAARMQGFDEDMKAADTQLSDKEKEHLKQLKREADAQEAAAAAAGEGARAMEDYRDAMEDADKAETAYSRNLFAAQRTRARAGADQVDANKKDIELGEDMEKMFADTERHNKDFDEGQAKSIKESIKTPLDKFNEQQTRIQEMHESGQLNMGEFVRANAANEKALRESVKEEYRPTAAAAVGSGAAYSVVASAMSQSGPKSIEDILRASKEIQQREYILSLEAAKARQQAPQLVQFP